MRTMRKPYILAAASLAASRSVLLVAPASAFLAPRRHVVAGVNAAFESRPLRVSFADPSWSPSDGDEEASHPSRAAPFVDPPPDAPYPANKYDPDAARRYFEDKRSVVAGRAAHIAALSGAFLSKLALDRATGKLEANASRRAEELSALLTSLGPGFVKIGQSLSIRADLLSPAYVRGLKSLQDQVPPFSTEEARAIIESELGGKIEDIFVNFPEEPIAAASLGQVYKATLRGSEDGTEREVAVKVQRPDIMDQIALDMHLIREVAPVFKRVLNPNTDFVGLVDKWGVGFVDELDYLQEAANAKSFMEGIAHIPLAEAVFAPPVVDDLTTGKVLTTEWVAGERLDRSSSEDVGKLCSLAMNTYMTMMLETGHLHCDPHPGNLLRTPDGRLCILDWGMVTRLDPDLQVMLIEHTAHLMSSDYKELPRDLLRLGFVPQDKAHLIRGSGVVEAMAEIYEKWKSGGGGIANKCLSDMEDLVNEKGNMFQIPLYFAYIAKSFAVLEGIGLSNDANYSILKDCLPYISKRLLTDKSETMGGALSTFIFGPDKSNQDRIIDYDRVEMLVSGFSDYSTTTSGELLGAKSSQTEIVEEVLDLVATEEETPLQQIFVEQSAKVISSSTRLAWSRIRSRVLPLGRKSPSSQMMEMNKLDKQTLETTRNLIALLRNATLSSKSLVNPSTVGPTKTAMSFIIARKLFEKRIGVLKTSNRIVNMMMQLGAVRLERLGKLGLRNMPGRLMARLMLLTVVPLTVRLSVMASGLLALLRGPLEQNEHRMAMATSSSAGGLIAYNYTSF